MPTKRKEESPETSKDAMLEKQQLSNEREHEPATFGGMATPPVETDDPPVRPDLTKETPRDELEPAARLDERDIQKQGA